MEAEIKATVKLWSDHIRNSDQDMGDGIGNALASIAKDYAPKITDKQIAIFENVLTENLRKRILESDCWNHADPEFGSWCRSLETDYGFCREIEAAVQASGINRSHIPIKSYTLTCPGYIWHAFGYSAKKQKLIITESN